MSTRRGRGALPRLLLLSCAVVTTACRHEPTPPSALVDGSPAMPSPVELATIGDPTIAARVEVVAAAQLGEGAAAASCLAESGVDARQGPIVTRTGVDGESVTFRTASGPGLLACDGTDPGTPGSRWCGRAYGRLDGRRLTDPRLDLACTTAADDPVAFAWVEPASGARFVAVRRNGFVEVHETRAGLPVRVTGTDLDFEASSASFAVSEHDARGDVLRSYTLTARVAG